MAFVNQLGIRQIRIEVQDGSNPLSLRVRIGQIISELRTLAPIPELIGRLHPADRAAHDFLMSYKERVARASALCSPINPGAAFIEPSGVKDGMWVLTTSMSGPERQEPHPVAAMLAGKAIEVGEDENGLQSVRIAHAGGFTTEYEPLVKSEVKVRARVNRGQLVGLVAPTSAEGLRIGFKGRDNKYIDPRNYLPPIP
jgi:hypothetical protein